MDITKGALRNPMAVAISVALLVFVGIYSLTQLPIQLFPDIESPRISIQTFWRAASPLEIESEILEPQEEVLQGIPGLKAMQAWSNNSASWINLEFGLETDMQKTLIEVISRMNRLKPLPRDATEPVIHMGGGGGGTPALIYFFLQVLPGNDRPVTDYVTYFEDTIKPRLESIPGVARVEAQSGSGGQEELQIAFDPYRAAELGIDLTHIASFLGSSNNVSGGQVDVGRRKYTLRFAGRYEPEKLGELILDWRDGSPIRLSDIATIEVSRGDRNDFTVQNGNPAMSIRFDRENDANVLATLEAVKQRVEEIRVDMLEPQGLTMAQSFDASVFIYRAVKLVTSNLVMGIILAVGILWWFMRQRRATLIVALAIPISILSTFVVLSLTGRSLNVISLAGLAFAAGMVLDAAIVVLENIVRINRASNEEEKAQAAEKGTKQVLGALLASTATTVAIFIPVIFLKDVEGQLFSDLALTIAIAVFISFIVAITILPAAAMKWLRQEEIKDRLAPFWQRTSDRIMRITGTLKRRIALIVGLMAIPAIITFALFPPLDYLPPVKRDAVDVYFNFPPGVNVDFIEREIVNPVVERLQPYMDGTKQPALKNYYVIIWPNGGTIGIRALDQSRVKELEQIVKDEILVDLPDTQAFAQQGNLFGGFGSGRNVQLYIQSADANALRRAATAGMDAIRAAFPGSNVRANPNIQQAEPELRLTPDDSRIMEVGWNRARVASLIRAMGDGLYVGEYFDGTKRMNIIFKSDGWDTPEELAAIPVITPSGDMVQIGELVETNRTVGPSQIQRIDGRRTQTLNLSPPDEMSLQEAMQIIEEQIEPVIQAELPADGVVNYGGSADSLKSAIANMSENFIFALALLFILMAGLFRSVKDSLLVLLTIPLATVGGIIALQVLNLFSFQSLDLLTMIGFVILLGLVVNNAILLVHQTRSAEREGVAREDAVRQALMLRLRPIFMSTLTSIFGMMPLLLMPGAGSVIYRGLAAVIVGGMSVSTIFTLILLPSFLRMGESAMKLSGANTGLPLPQAAKLNKHQDKV